MKAQRSATQFITKVEGRNLCFVTPFVHYEDLHIAHLSQLFRSANGCLAFTTDHSEGTIKGGWVLFIIRKST